MRLYLAFFIIIIQFLNNTIMGRGDIKTKKGKIFAGSFGKTRLAKPAAKKAAVKKAAPKK